MAVTDISELRKKRQAKKTKNIIIKIFVVLLICGIIVVAVFTGDRWYPYLRDMFTSPPAGGLSQGSAELAEGMFPIKVEGGMGYQLMSMDNAFALLDDSQFHVYSTEGKIMTEKQHTYANPILCVSGNKALIYDEGGREFSLESKYKTVYSRTAEDVIYLATLSSSDYAAVVTRSDKFLAMLKIYDQNGKDFFTYYSYDSRIINVTFNSQSTGCVVTVLTAEGGRLMSKLIRFDFTDKDPKWESTAVPTLALDVRFTGDGIVMIGDTMTACFNTDGVLMSQYTYENPITDYDANGAMTAIITENSDLRRTEMITFIGIDCNSPKVIVLDDNSKRVFTDGKSAYILDSAGIDVYDSLGVHIAETRLEDDYDDLCKIGKYIFLLGYDSINRISFSG